ncbi:MAG: hypothetical protein WC683_08505 [bacterium]
MRILSNEEVHALSQGTGVQRWLEGMDFVGYWRDNPSLIFTSRALGPEPVYVIISTDFIREALGEIDG